MRCAVLLALVASTLDLAAAPAVAAQAAVTGSMAQTEAVELEVKAAYLYKFANYAEWPDDAFRGPVDPIVIGVFGSDELVAELKRLTQGKIVKGRGFVVRPLLASADPGDVHILFIGNTDRSVAARWLSVVGNRHALTVSDSRRVFASGTMVNLVVVNDRVRFEVDLRAVQRSRLRLSALMLTAAHRVQKVQP